VPLVTCPDCHQRISDAAPACIHCGRPNVTAPPAPADVASAARRRHPLAGAAPRDTPSPRHVLRFVTIGVVIVLLAGSWIFGGGREGRSDLLSGLISLGIGVSLLLMQVPEAPARTPGARRRGDWGEWFSRQEAQREFHWNWIAGCVFIVVGTVYLLMAAL
jgi:hypothetical protein